MKKFYQMFFQRDSYGHLYLLLRNVDSHAKTPHFEEAGITDSGSSKEFLEVSL